MKRGISFAGLLLVLALALTTMTPEAFAGKRNRNRLPNTPPIPTTALPETLQVPPAVEALVGDDPSPQFALRVVVAFLELTEDQVNALVGLLRERHEAVVPLIQAIHEKQRLIYEQLNSGAPDPATIGQLVIEVHQLLYQIHEAQEEFLAGFTALLNEEQLRRYHAMQLAQQLQPFLPAFQKLHLF